MKNKEKYAEEIKNYNGTNFCKDFIKPIIYKKENCCGIGCERCAMLTALWLDEEYTEPGIDWSKVEVDTPILVRDNEDDYWHKFHFAECKDGEVYAWIGGGTSWTSDDSCAWKYAKLAEGKENKRCYTI